MNKKRDTYWEDLIANWPKLSEWRKFQIAVMVWFETSKAGEVWRWLVYNFTVDGGQQ